MATVQQLIDDANRVIAETQQGGNTQSRIGNLYLGIIDFIDILDRRTIDGYEYDDTALKEAIARIDRAIENLDKALEDAITLANQERKRLDNLVNELDSDIEDKVNRMLDDASALQDHAATIRQLVNEGEIYWKSEWNTNIEAYLQEVGVWAREGDVIKTQWSEIKQDVSSIQRIVAEVQTDLEGRPTSTQWSQITQKVNSIEQSVNSLVNDGNITEALQSSIKQSIDNGIASLKLDSTYAKVDVEDAKNVLEWMYAAFKNSSSSEMSYAEMVAAGKSGINNGVSEVRTYVNAIRDGDFLKYEAVSSIESKVNDVITGLYNRASADDAQSTMFSQIKKGSNDIAEIVTHCTNDYSEASIATKFDNFRAGLVVHSDLERATAELTAAYKNEITTSTANLVLESTMNSALAQMSSYYNSKFAGVIAKADLESAFVEMVASSTDKNNGAVASIVAKVNNGGSSIKMTADIIEMTDAFANSITANSAFIRYLTGGTATFTGAINAKSLVLDDGVSIAQEKITRLASDLNTINGKFSSYTTTQTFNEALTTYNEKLNEKISTDALSISDASYDSATGLYKRTITFNGTNYTELTGGNFVVHNIGKGTDSDGSNYFMVSNVGLLKARNAIIYGTVYANAGRIAGWEIGTDALKHETDSVGLYSGSDYNSTYNDSAVRFWAGGNSRDAAYFRVTKSGSLYSSKADITGAIIANSIEVKAGTVTGNVDITGSFNIKSGSSTVLTIDGNSASTSASGDLTILDSQGLYIKRGNEGFRLTASGGFQRFNASQNTLVPFYAGRCVKTISSSGTYTLDTNDDFILCTNTSTVYIKLPSYYNVGVGKIITIKVINGNVWVGPTDGYLHVGNDAYRPTQYKDLNNADRAELIYVGGGNWHWNYMGT